MLSALAAFLAASQPAEPPSPSAIGRTAWIFGTVSHSEWCPAGHVRLDLRTGRYEFTLRARRPSCVDPKLERPVRTGSLGARRLAAVRSAYLRVFREGLEKPICRDGGRPEDITVSNGGTPILILATGWRTVAAGDDLSCWSEAASALHELLDDTFARDRP